MEKKHFCRICRTESNLKYTTKELKELNKKQLLLAQTEQQGQTKNRASKKLLLDTPTLGNICQICDERIQIFHRLDDGGHDSSSDVEIEVVNNLNGTLPAKFMDALQNGNILHRTQRPETPVIVDDDDMLFNIFMQKFDQKTQQQRQHINSISSQQQVEKQFTNQFHTTYTPPQSTGSSENDESKIIEILNSRENTPAPIQAMPSLTSNCGMVDAQGHRIVAIIELDDVDEDGNEDRPKKDNENQSDFCIPVINPSTNLSHTTASNERRSVLLSPNKNLNVISPTFSVEDDEEIVFRKVDIEYEINQSSKKKKRKSYDQRELRLVATLSLVSSDSEMEDSPLNVQVKKMPNAVLTESATLAIKKSFSCNDCKVVYPDSESLLIHQRIHEGIKCTLCQIGFQQIKRLIHHMRYKHREYSGDVLSEKPRSGKDSCMTIRLRYMQHTTFYECQLCGRIDDVFKEHKEHIIAKHPNESKTLKDPIMKQLKCPVCKSKCGVQYLSLCRHLINSHEYKEYKNHLRELVHVGAFGWNMSRQQEVAETAKIFQFTKRKTFFFECKICRKVVAGYLHHLRHLNEHKKLNNNETKAKMTANIPLKNSSHLDKLCNSLKKSGACASMNLRKKDTHCEKITGYTNLNNKTKQTESISKSSIETKVQSKYKNNNFEKIKNKTTTNKSVVEVKNESRKPIHLKTKLKPKENVIKKFPNSVKLTKGKLKPETSKRDNKKYKENSTKVKGLELRPQVIKVKVKAPIRQIDLQKYKCNYCLKKFKGFRIYNLHLLRQHKENEYNICSKCNKFYTNFSNYEDHITKCTRMHSTSKRKHNCSEKATISIDLTESSELCVNKVPNMSNDNSVCLEDNCLWLKDLLKLNEPLEINDSITFKESPKTALFTKNSHVLQCCYCLHLFVSEEDLMEHKKHNHLQNSDILIKYKPFKNA